MNKIFTTLLALACAGAAYADGFTFTYDDQPVENGATIDVGYTLTAGVLCDWQPSFYVTADHNTRYVVDLTSPNLDNIALIQDCSGGGCKPAPVKTTYPTELIDEEEPLKSYIAANTPFHLEIHRMTTALPAVATQGDLTGVLTVYEESNPDAKIVVTINFLAKDASEVGALDNVAANGEFVRLESGNTLSYNLDGGARLEVYSILGTRMVDRAVNGNGSVSLSGLGRGVYIYRAGRHTGKIVVK